MKLDIQIAQQADAVVEIFTNTRAGMTYLPTVHTAEETREYFGGLVIAGKIYVARNNEGVVGFMQVEDGWLNHLYVDPQFQGHGVGKQLLDAAKKISPDGLQLWVFEENTRAIQFYEREGFVLAEKRTTEQATNEENLADRRYMWGGREESL